MSEAVEFKTNFKPVRGQWKVDRQKRRAEAAGVVSEELDRLAGEERARLAVTRKAIYQRDHGCCRVCGKALRFEHQYPATRMQWHHIVYKSAGGDDSIDNGLTVCWKCHRDEHESLIEIKGTGQCVTIRRFHPETGRVVEQWESAVAA